MEKVKLSTLSKDEIVIIDGDDTVNTVEDILGDIDFFKEEDVYTTIPHNALFDSKYIIDNAIEDEYQDMYEGWYESIKADVTKEDIKEIQVIFDRILARNPTQNIAYSQDKLIEFDI